MERKCLFCEIARGEAKADILHESEDAVIIRDIHPSAPVHYLIVPRTHITSIAEVEPAHEALMGKMIFLAREAAERLQLEGYKLVFNVGRAGGQVIDHVHLHILGGWKKGETPKLSV